MHFKWDAQITWTQINTKEKLCPNYFKYLMYTAYCVYTYTLHEKCISRDLRDIDKKNENMENFVRETKCFHCFSYFKFNGSHVFPYHTHIHSYCYRCVFQLTQTYCVQWFLASLLQFRDRININMILMYLFRIYNNILVKYTFWRLIVERSVKNICVSKVSWHKILIFSSFFYFFVGLHVCLIFTVSNFKSNE